MRPHSRHRRPGACGRRQHHPADSPQTRYPVSVNGNTVAGNASASTTRGSHSVAVAINGSTTAGGTYTWRWRSPAAPRSPPPEVSTTSRSRAHKHGHRRRWKAQSGIRHQPELGLRRFPDGQSTNNTARAANGSKAAAWRGNNNYASIEGTCPRGQSAIRTRTPWAWASATTTRQGRRIRQPDRGGHRQQRHPESTGDNNYLTSATAATTP